MSGENRYLEYLKAVAKPFKKLTKLDFLQPDNSVAFSIGSGEELFRNKSKYNTKAFIQSGTLNVTKNNGQRRNATITLSNIDNNFEYSINNLWFGQKVRLAMGLVLPNDTEFYLPQGVFYIKNPKAVLKPESKQISFPLVDKWAMLDGSLGGVLANMYVIKNDIDKATGQIIKRKNVFEAIRGLLVRSKYNLEQTDDLMAMIDNVSPIFTDYYNDKKYSYKLSDGTIEEDILMTDLPYDITENIGGTIGKLILSLTETFSGQCGYDCTGTFRVEPSQDDLSDLDKPVLWNFTPKNSQLLGITETFNTSSVYNDVLVVGQSGTNGQVWGRAKNLDYSSDTNINLIGVKTHVENKAEYWNAKQCVDLAQWLLKRKTVLQKSITVESSQMFHLLENQLITIERTDKKGSPIERHLINSFSIPIGETGSMTINATSVNDFPTATLSQYPQVE